MDNYAILFFLNGNNELEPEIWQSFLKLLSLCVFENITIIIQIARQDFTITKMIRYGYKYPHFDDNWIGVRRYVIQGSSCKCINKFDNKNMADPYTIYDFIIWSQENYNADKYILICGGHVYQFVGISPDFTYDKAYILGLPELSLAIQKACEESKIGIDLLVMDSCYLSTFETICELSKYHLPAVKYMITYIGEGSIQGLPYDILVKTIEKTIHNEKLDVEKLIKNIINIFPTVNFFNPMIGLKIDYKIIRLCKNEFSNIAYEYLKNRNIFNNLKTPYDLLTVNNTYPWFLNLLNIHLLADMLIVCKTSKPFYNNYGLPIHVLYKYIPDKERQILYQRLFFSVNNYWVNLVCSLNLNEKIIYEEPKMNPIWMSENIFQAFISNMNKHISFENQQKIKNKIIKKRKWNFHD